MEGRPARFAEYHGLPRTGQFTVRAVLRTVIYPADSDEHSTPVTLFSNEVTVESNFHLYRARLDVDEDTWIGRRRDVLRRVDGELKIATRHVFLEQTGTAPS